MTAENAQSLKKPDALPDRYEILGLLGAGGMGRVWHARDRVLDREVAVKVLSTYCALDEKYAKRFLNEARAAARLNHPNIVQIYEFGNEDGFAYLVMEYVDGPSLKGDLASNGPYSEGRAAELIGEACNALGAAHRQGIMHRDVKPDNMMLTKSGAFKLVDLGLAKHEEGSAEQTASGAIMGTPHYISPEQIMGAKSIDRRSDIYSLGASLFYLVTGSVPYEGSSGAHIMSRHLNDPLPDPRSLAPDLSPAFCNAVSKAMAKDPEHRYQDTLDLKADLDAVRGTAPVERRSNRSDVAEPTIPLVRTPSGAAFCPTFKPPCSHDDLQRMEDALAAAIGPLARVLVGKESRTANTRSALVEALAAHVPDRTERRKFLKSCGVTNTGSGSLLDSGSRSLTTPATLAPDIVAVLSRHLADRIGPVAGVLVKREASAGGGVDAVIERLAAHVPDEAEREVFLAGLAELRE